MILTSEYSVVDDEFGDARSNRAGIVSDRMYTGVDYTYRAPKRKIAHTPSFLPKGSCNSKIWIALDTDTVSVDASIL